MRVSSARPLLLPLLPCLMLVAAGCATQTPIADPAGAAAPGEPAQCPTWKYPELSGNTNNWVKAGCEKCAAAEPGQSPIVLDPSTANHRAAWKLPSLPVPAPYPQPLDLKVKGNNYKFPVTPRGGPPLTMAWETGGVVWTFDEFHFHVPAEHAVVQQPASLLELHVQAKGKLRGEDVAAVFAVQFAPATGSLYSLSAVASAINGGKDIPFDLTPLLANFNRQPTFIYMGSLTTPDCGTGVMFFVLKDPVAVDTSSWMSITQSLFRLNGVPNARPLQVRPVGQLPKVALVEPKE